MFGIGFPEMIVILAVALIVVGPDKLPDLARSVAKGVMELKKTLNEVKESLTEEEGIFGEVTDELKKTTDELRQLDMPPSPTNEPTTDSNKVYLPEGSGRPDPPITSAAQASRERPWEKDRKTLAQTADPTEKQMEQSRQHDIHTTDEQGDPA